MDNSASTASSGHFESGKIQANYKHSGNWKLHEGDGARNWTQRVNFVKKFDSAPRVAVALSAQDVVTNYDHRISTTATNVDASGFTLNVSTWSDSGVWGVTITWFAFDNDFAKDQGDGHGLRMCAGRCSMKKTNPGYNLHKGKGDRNYVQHISFDTNFAAAPLVFVALSTLDVLNETDHRITISAENIKNNGFDIKLGTWSDTTVYSCDATWIAFHKSFTDAPTTMGFCIQTGRQPFKKSQPNYTLYDGNGARDMKWRVNFTKKFSSNPSVASCLCQLDVIRDNDHRIHTVADNITPSGFDLKVGTWSDTKVWGASATWLAFGKVDPPAPAPAPAPVTTTTTTSSSTNNNTTDADLSQPAKKQKTDNKDDDSYTKEDEKECKVCFDSEINTVLIPCGHLCVCSGCAEMLQKKGAGQCPICKQKIQKVIKTYKT